MSSRPRRLVRPSSAFSFSTSLSNAAAGIRSSLHHQNPTSFYQDIQQGRTRGLTARDTVSRCLSTPTASPFWQNRQLLNPTHPLVLSSSPPSIIALVSTQLLSSSSRLTEPLLLPQPSSIPSGSQRGGIPMASIIPCHSFLGNPIPNFGSISCSAEADSSRSRCYSVTSRIIGSLWPNRQTSHGKKAHGGGGGGGLGPLLGHHALRAASTFHFLHSGLADVAAFGPYMPQEGSLKSRSVHDASAGAENATPALCVATETEALSPDEASTESSAGDTSVSSSLKLVSGACALPHPDKAEKGGEDAYFISSACQAVGVADGVGGWADVGIDAGAYARELMAEALTAVEKEAELNGGHVDPLHALETAHKKTLSQGSSTACLILLGPERLAAANLGDSGFMIIRSGRTIFKSPPQQHDFNFPFQLGSQGGDSPNTAEVYSLPVVPGDVIVLGTDGLFDNVFDGELASMVMHSLMAGRTPQNTAEHIAALARIRAADRVRFSPFARAAMEAGYRYYGGKMDDITVVVSYVTSSGSAK